MAWLVMARRAPDRGFLETTDGREIYFHRNSVIDGGFDRLTIGTHVAFTEEEGDKGPQASTVRMLGKHGMRIAPVPAAEPEWQHFPHDADIGVRGWGATPAEAFEQAAARLAFCTSTVVVSQTCTATRNHAIRTNASDQQILNPRG